MMNPSSQQADRKALVLFILLATYILGQFSWWAWLLITKESEVAALQQQLLADGALPAVPVRTPGRILWMIAGEGGVFILLVLLGLWISFRTVKHELAITAQQRDFLLAASHELRTPIAGLKLHLQTLQRQGLQPAARDELQTLALSEAERLGSLTEKILLATRLEEGTFPVQPQDMDVQVLLDEVCHQAERTYAKGHRLSWEVAQSGNMHCDPHALRSIVRNLLENACKYAPPGTAVQLSLDLTVDGWLLQVADEGPGVPAHERSLIFKKFHRGGSEETRTAKGTGLGLFIAQRAAQAMGGRLEHRPRTPHGSIFALHLPVA